MTPPIFLATLGQRPEAITVALDVLLPRHHYGRIGIVHTDPVYSGIAEAFDVLMPVLKRDYPGCELAAYELRAADHTPLLDITDAVTAQGYFYGLLEIIRQFRQQFIPVHLLVPGGRKAMSIYATVAATYLFGEHDRVWAVLTEPSAMQRGVFHLPPTEGDAVQVVELPLLPASIPAGAMSDLPTVLKRRSPRQRFLDALTKQEAALAETFKQNPYASNAALGELLCKSPRTVENQFRSMYDKMFEHFDMPVDENHQRQALLDILIGRV